MTDIDQAIRTRVEAFVDDLTELIREAAVKSVHSAFMGGQPITSSSGGGRAKRATRRAASGKAATRKAKSGKRIRRSTEDIQQIGAKIKDHVTANPGLRLGAIAKALGISTKDARRPAFALVENGVLKTTGQRGGTRYFPKGAFTKKARKHKTAKRKTRKGKAAA